MCLPVKPYKIEREWKGPGGLQCAVVQANEAGHRCGYVRVPPGHPNFGQAYETPEVRVHGGLTFAELEPCSEHEDGQGWWFGFDFCHADDAMYDPDADPEKLETEGAREMLKIHRRFPLSTGEHFWTQAEAEAETERLAEQLAAV